MFKHSFTLLNLMFIGAIVYFGVNAFYLATSAKFEVPPPRQEGSPSTPPQSAERAQPLSHYAAIDTRNLFDTKATVEAPVKSSVDVQGLEQTQLKLKLWGTVTGSPEEAYAVIEEQGQRQQNLYRIGDTIQNATVKLILREKIVLNVDGKDEVLEIEKSVKGSGGSSPAAIARAPVPPPQEAQPARTQRITLRRSQIEDAIRDVGELMSQVNIRPHFFQGKPDGMMLSRVKPNSIFMRMGLRNGDVITGVNGRSIETVDDALGFYENLKTADSVMLELKRGGRPRAIEYQIR
jgi:general secretion pathway protein C